MACAGQLRGSARVRAMGRRFGVCGGGRPGLRRWAVQGLQSICPNCWMIIDFRSSNFPYANSAKGPVNQPNDESLFIAPFAESNKLWRLVPAMEHPYIVLSRKAALKLDPKLANHHLPAATVERFGYHAILLPRGTSVETHTRWHFRRSFGLEFLKIVLQKPRHRFGARWKRPGSSRTRHDCQGMHCYNCRH